MMDTREIYIRAVKDACNEMRLDYFPQVEASELLYRVITLEDIYLPLSLDASISSYDVSGHLDLDELMRRIDEKLAALEAQSNDREEGGDGADDEDADDSGGPLLKDPDEASPDAGLRLLIEANPGSGKTTFCKRLVLAMLENDGAFFEKYASENDLHFNARALPLLIGCKSVAAFPADELASLDFGRLLYRLCEQSLGPLFSEIPEDSFLGLLEACGAGNLCLILDGWDEILDEEKETAFLGNLNRYLERNPSVDAVVTIRASYAAPELIRPFTDRLALSPLTDDDIREFCRKWCRVILNPDSQRSKNYALLAEQILSTKDAQIRMLMRNPLDLSLLLTVSKNDGRLPENRAELFKKLVDLYIFWSTNKSTGSLSAKSIRVFLSYIACHFTKNDRLVCDENELMDIIEQAVIDLEGTFSEDVSAFDGPEIARELSHTGILTKVYNGNRYSFSESRRGTHRQMQEYLTAVAILLQYADQEYNSLQPIEILEDKYEKQRWREVIIFLSLMNNGRLRQEIIRRLTQKAEEKPDDNYAYTNLLFDFVVNGAEIRAADKHRIYDLLFTKHITDRQITNILQMVTGETRSSSDFVSYISDRFAESAESGGSDYGYAKAIIEASLASQKGISPFERALTLVQSADRVDVMAGIQIVRILAWCKYVKISNAFSRYYTSFRMTPDWIAAYKVRLAEQQSRTEILESVREAVLADYVSFYDLFTEQDVSRACSEIGEEDRNADSEIVLSIVPVWDSNHRDASPANDDVREKYRKKLRNETENNDYDALAFTFNVCAVLGCYSPSQREEAWKEICAIYDSLKNEGYIGTARYRQLKRQREGEGPEGSQHAPVGSAVTLSGREYRLWIKTEHGPSHVVVANGQEEMRIDFPESGLSEDADGFVNSVLADSTMTNNNLAYLLRRHELKSISKNGVSVSPEQLLESGAQEYDAFSVLNYALSVSGISADQKGDYDAGKEYLLSVKAHLDPGEDTWKQAVSWWLGLAVRRGEYEGLAVLSWLTRLGFLKVETIGPDDRNALSARLRTLGSLPEDLAGFAEALRSAAE